MAHPGRGGSAASLPSVLGTAARDPGEAGSVSRSPVFGERARERRRAARSGCLRAASHSIARRAVSPNPRQVSQTNDVRGFRLAGRREAQTVCSRWTPCSTRLAHTSWALWDLNSICSTNSTWLPLSQKNSPAVLRASSVAARHCRQGPSPRLLHRSIELCDRLGLAFSQCF